MLHQFFRHEDPWVALAALEVYIRRAYRAYHLIGLDYEQGDAADDEPTCLTWQFRLRKSASPPPTPRGGGVTEHNRVASYADLTHALNTADGIEDATRSGVMFVVDDLDDLESNLVKALVQLPDSGRGTLRPGQAAATRGPAPGQGNVVNAAVRVYGKNAADKSIDDWSAYFCALANKLAAQLERRSASRITFSVCRIGQYPSYFTIRKSSAADGQWTESSTIRDIEPALAFQLELDRLSNFNITPVGVENHQIHVYYAVGKENPSDARFFVRALVRPGRLRGNMKTVDYLVRAATRVVTG